MPEPRRGRRGIESGPARLRFPVTGPNQRFAEPLQKIACDCAARLLAGLLRFFGIWAAITGAYAVMGGTCPFCGNRACPVGLGVAGILGALGSLVLTQSRHLLTVTKRTLTSRGHQ